MGWMRGIYHASDARLDVDLNVMRSYAREANPSIFLGEFPEKLVQEGWCMISCNSFVCSRND